MEFVAIAVQTIFLVGAITTIYTKIKSDIEVLRNDIKWIKRALFKEEG
ncbi:MAG: hypothetical protein AB1432_11635 [Bacteroidota bacterium]|jgi:hypothetical protein